METLNALDDDRHKAQKEVLLRHADYLANKAAAAHQIPTPRRHYAFGSASVFFFVVASANMVWEHHLGFRIYPITWVLAAAAFGACFITAYSSLGVELRRTARERKRFIAEGCPADFLTEQMLHRQRAEQEHERSVRPLMLWSSLGCSSSTR
jgi:hypothetical protein